MECNTHPKGILVPIIPLSTMAVKLPFFQSTVSAGFPSPADDYLEARLSLDELVIRNPSSTFFVKVEGHSMTGAGIYPEDILVVDRSKKAKPNDVIIAAIDGEFTVKRLIKEADQYF
jgi:DNA polymerase V